VAQRPRVKVFSGRQVDPGLIQDAEGELGIPLPELYKEWLLKFGNLRVGAYPVLTLAPRDVRDISDSDLIYNFRLDARDGGLPVGYILLHLPDTDESFRWIPMRTMLKRAAGIDSTWTRVART